MCLGRDPEKLSFITDYLKAVGMFRDYSNESQDPEFTQVTSQLRHGTNTAQSQLSYSTVSAQLQHSYSLVRPQLQWSYFRVTAELQ